MDKIFNIKENKNLRSHLRITALPPERIIWDHVRNSKLGYKFRRQHGIGNYIVDFYCPFLKLIIEIDGDYHGDEEVNKKDVERDRYFASLGLIVKRYTVREVLHQTEGVVNDLKKICDDLLNNKTKSVQSF